jgi:proteasome accessory factor B
VSSRKSERILNLTICLLAAGRYLSREQIRAAVEGYAGLSDASFERTFERDKDDLRKLGIPVETGTNSEYFQDDFGYRIPRGDFELPPIEFTADEAAVVSMAGRVWQEANLASSTQLALAKLRAAGLPTDSDRLGLLAPARPARGAAFEPLWEALVSGRRVRFSYRRPRAATAAVRTVEPWGIVSHKGSWYLIGHDVDRDAPRMFKLVRIVDEPTAVGPVGAVSVPANLDLRELASRLEPAQPSKRAVVAVRSGHTPWLTRRGVAVDPPPLSRGAAVPAGFETYAVCYPEAASFAAELAGAGADVIVLEPADLRDRVRDQLRAVAVTAE